MGIGALCNLEHRGAQGAEANTGDGAGITIQMPDRFPRMRSSTPYLPPAGSMRSRHGVPPDRRRRHAMQVVSHRREDRRQRACAVLGWRDVPVDDSMIGGARCARSCRSSGSCSSARARADQRPHDARAARVRRAQEAGRARGRQVGVLPSLRRGLLIYKGMLTARAARRSSSPTSTTSGSSRRSRWCTRRYSTNTFPSWPLAHPYRYIAHNGEINTVQGNRNWMRARERCSTSDRHPRRPARIFPIVTPGAATLASFDEVLELLHLGGRSICRTRC